MANMGKMNPGAVKASKEQQDAFKAYCKSKGIKYLEDLKVCRAIKFFPKSPQDAIKAFCESQGIEYWEDVHVGNTGTIIPLYLPKYRIAVHIGDSQQWYDAVKRCTHPIFIRENDTVVFVIEKVINTIEKHVRFMSGRKQPKTSFQQKRAKRFKDFLSSLKAEKKFVFKRTK